MQLKKTLVGVKVEVTHRGDERRKYRISGITNQPLSQLRRGAPIHSFANLILFCFILKHLRCIVPQTVLH